MSLVQTEEKCSLSDTPTVVYSYYGFLGGVDNWFSNSVGKK